MSLVGVREQGRKLYGPSWDEPARDGCYRLLITQESNKQLYKSLSLQSTTGRDDQAIPTLNISMSVKSNHFPLRTGDTGASTWTDYETAFPVTRSRKIPFCFNHLVRNSQIQQHYPEVYRQKKKILKKGNKGNISHPDSRRAKFGYPLESRLGGTHILEVVEKKQNILPFRENKPTEVSRLPPCPLQPLMEWCLSTETALSIFRRFEGKASCCVHLSFRRFYKLKS